MFDARRTVKKAPATYGDYLTWPEEERWEIIDGEAFDITPAPATLHQAISGNLFGLLWTFLREKPCKVFPAPFDVRLPKGNLLAEVLPKLPPRVVREGPKKYQG